MVLEGDVFYKFYNHFIYKFFGLILHLLNRCFISCVKDTSDVFFTFSSKYPTHWISSNSILNGENTHIDHPVALQNET